MNTKVIARRTVNKNIGISFCDTEFLRRSCESRDGGGSRDGGTVGIGGSHRQLLWT